MWDETNCVLHLEKIKSFTDQADIVHLIIL